MKKNLIFMLFITTTAVSPVACGSSKVPASADSSGTSASKDTAAFANALRVVIRYLVTYPSTGTQTEGALKLGELIEECLDERMKMESYPSSQPGDKTATLEGPGNGTIEMTECATMDLSAFNDTWFVPSLPYLWESRQQACVTVMDPTAREMLEADAQANGFIIIAWIDIESRSMMNQKKTVNAPTDFTGLRIRCMQDSILADSTNAVGVITMSLGAGEIYTGLQQETVDGLGHTPSVVVVNGWQELAKYFFLTEHFTIPDPVFVSKVWFDGLPAENQEAVLEAGKKFSDVQSNEIWSGTTENGVKAMKERGVEIVEVDKALFEETVKPVADKSLADASEGQKALYDLLTKTRENY